MEKILILKADGTRETFDGLKLYDSLIRAKAAPDAAEDIRVHIEKEVRTGMTTHDIYSHAFRLLSKMHRPLALRYSLKRSLMELGPAGFAFEKFIGEIFKKKGFTVETDKLVQGHCVEHEVDVIAWNDKELIMSEAKFHNQPGVKSDLKVVLYVKSRMDDLRKATFSYGGSNRTLTDGWLITNTKFTTSAIKYAECSGLKIIGWNYPAQGSLQDLIEESGLHPLTCLTTLDQSEKRGLLDRGVVLCETFREDTTPLQVLGMNNDRIKMIVDESNLLCPTVS
ncbi:MAG TPA: restriction endonuclease [Candidatus Paceibacterota bacterium]